MNIFNLPSAVVWCLKDLINPFKLSQTNKKIRKIYKSFVYYKFNKQTSNYYIDNKNFRSYVDSVIQTNIKLEIYIDVVEKLQIVKNVHSFKFRRDCCKRKTDLIKKDLIEAIYHPRRFIRYLELFDFDMCDL